MDAWLLFLACGVCLVWTQVHSVIIAETGEQTREEVKSYVVNLDEQPRQRWNNVLKDFDAQIIVDLLDYILKILDVNGILKLLTVKMAANLNYYISQPYAEELRGIRDFWNIDMGYVVLLNIFYDIVAHSGTPIGSHACTSIVTMDQDNHILHGRNFDYNTLPQILAKLVVQIEFQKYGKTVFYFVSFAGMIGATTAFKPGLFSLSLNQRNEGELWENLVSSLEGETPTLIYSREVLILEQAQSYDEAVQMLGKMRVIAPLYVIVGGVKPYEGSVFIGNRWGANFEGMNNTLQHGWYVLETNYDPWNSPPADDDRRGAAIKMMGKLGQKNMNKSTMFQLLSTTPVLSERTVFTTVMSADESIFYTVLRQP